MTDISAIRAETDARLRAESEYRALTDSTASAIVSVGSNGLIRTWNRAAETVFGYTQEEVAGSPLTMLMPERFRKDHTAALARVSAGGERRILGPAELVALRKDGTEFPIELSLGAWEWNGDLMHTGVITDIADRVAAREELESSHAVLSNLLESKDRLIAAVSHELRTPLTSIYGYARLLADEADSLPPEQRAEFHRVIAEQSSDVSGIIEDLLVASRTGSEAIRVSASPVNLAEIVREVIERQGFDEKVQIEIAGQAAALVDRLRLRQIIRNLLANVVRHWGMKCRVNIRRNTHTSIVEVSDNGDGAPEQSVEHIFEAFHTAGTREKTPVDSIGIGLSVSRRLARLMGGDLTYRRDAGWTRFELEVPAFGATPAETGQTPPVKNSTRQSGFVLEVGMPVGLTTTVDEGRAAMGCGGPGSGTCPLVEGDGCALASSAAAIVFHLDLDDAYNRDILRCYREGLGPDIPIEVHIKAGDEITYAEDLVGTTTVIEAADPPPDKSGSRTESSRAPQVAGTDHQEPVHAAFDENGSRLRVGVDPSP